MAKAFVGSNPTPRTIYVSAHMVAPEGGRLASSFGLFVLVLGVVLVIFGYTDLSICLSLPNPPQGTSCWDPTNEPHVTFHNFAASAIAFYVGIIVTVSGGVMLVGGDVAKLLRKSKVE